MANAIDDFVAREAERQLKDSLEGLKKIHAEILQINQLGLNFSNNRGNSSGNANSSSASNVSQLNALERERLRIENALAVATARLTVAGEENTQELARRRQSLRVLGSVILVFIPLILSSMASSCAIGGFS